MRALATLTLAAMTAACAWKPSPVVMIGPLEEISAFTGEWSGEYRSIAADRFGTIWFKLEAGRDIAFGDVLMIPRETVMNEPSAPEQWRDHPQTLTIKFVRVRGLQVTGAIDPYTASHGTDILFTVFRGELKGDRVEGEFLILNDAGTEPQQGTWWAQRVKAR